jgi:hypothetical protein
MRDQSGGLDAAAASRVREAREAYVRYIAGLLESGMREGLLRRGDPLGMAGAYLAFLHAFSKAGRARTQPVRPGRGGRRLDHERAVPAVKVLRNSLFALKLVRGACPSYLPWTLLISLTGVTARP